MRVQNIDTGEYLWKFELWHSKAIPDDSLIFVDRPTAEKTESIKLTEPAEFTEPTEERSEEAP